MTALDTARGNLDSARAALLEAIENANRSAPQTFSPSAEYQRDERDRHRSLIEIARVRFDCYLALFREQVEAEAEATRLAQVKAGHELAERSVKTDERAADIAEQQKRIARRQTRIAQTQSDLSERSTNTGDAVREYTKILTIAAVAQVICAALQAFAVLR